MASERRFISNAAELLRGWNRAQLQLQPGLRLDEKFSVIYKSELAHVNRVTVVSGGGSGHEPAHSGYIGEAMLDVTVSGAIFSSPNVSQIYRALEVASSPKGTVLIVKNYTGDKLNFALAAERYKIATGNDVRVVLVADDVSVGRSRGTFVGRRGLAGTVIMHKVAGGAAQRCMGLDQIVDLCNTVSDNMGTIGISLEPAYVPGQRCLEKSDLNEIKLGMGIHNEPAMRHLPAETPTEEMIREMLETLLDSTKAEHAFLSPEAGQPGRHLVLLMNNLGGLSTTELGALTTMVTAQLKSKYNVVPCRTYAGTFLSALDGRGFSITLLSLDNSEDASTILNILDDPTTAIGWTSTIPAHQWMQESKIIELPDHISDLQLRTNVKYIPCNGNLFAKVVKSILAEVSIAEPMITRYDSLLGDGDCGTTLLAGAQAVMHGVEAGTLPTQNLSLGMLVLAEIVTEAMGGTSGALYGIFFSAFAAALNRSHEESTIVNVRYFADAAVEALKVLERFTGARVGHRTLMDALIPLVAELDKATPDEMGTAVIESALNQATAGCENTRHLEAKFGRSTYISNDKGIEKKDGNIMRFPDPGACGIVAVFSGLLKALR